MTTAQDEGTFSLSGATVVRLRGEVEYVFAPAPEISALRSQLDGLASRANKPYLRSQVERARRQVNAASNAVSTPDGPARLLNAQFAVAWAFGYVTAARDSHEGRVPSICDLVEREAARRYGKMSRSVAVTEIEEVLHLDHKTVQKWLSVLGFRGRWPRPMSGSRTLVLRKI